MLEPNLLTVLFLMFMLGVFTTPLVVISYILYKLWQGDKK
jgi:hypothetical protein